MANDVPHGAISLQVRTAIENIIISRVNAISLREARLASASTERLRSGDLIATDPFFEALQCDTVVIDWEATADDDKKEMFRQQKQRFDRERDCRWMQLAVALYNVLTSGQFCLERFQRHLIRYAEIAPNSRVPLRPHIVRCKCSIVQHNPSDDNAPVFPGIQIPIIDPAVPPLNPEMVADLVRMYHRFVTRSPWFNKLYRRARFLGYGIQVHFDHTVRMYEWQDREDGRMESIASPRMLILPILTELLWHRERAEALRAALPPEIDHGTKHCFPPQIRDLIADFTVDPRASELFDITLRDFAEGELENPALVGQDLV